MARSHLRWAGSILLAALMLALALSLAGCLPSATSEAAPNPTEFIATRVVVLLTQNARTDAAPRPAATPTRAPVVQGGAKGPVTQLPTAGDTLTPRAATVDPNFTPTPCADQACAASAGHFWLERPIAEDHVNYPDRTYPYGSTMDGQREPHHGVEFANASDTPVVAAGPGKVVVAGNDHTAGYGPATDFYGNLVVVQLDQAYQNQPVFILYGHLKSVLASLGQHVNTGEVLGLVGGTGVAIGPHLHFEVRVGENTYTAVRNPELWLKPLRYNGVYQGAVAGRVVDKNGKLVQGYPVVLRPVSVDSDTPRSRYLTTYTADQFNLGGDTLLQENFASTDLPLGTYTISVNTTKPYQQTINITSGGLTWVTFVVEPPPARPVVTPTR